MEDLRKEIEILKQTQDDINGYLNSLTTEIDSLRANYESLKDYVLTLESQIPSLEVVKTLRNDVDIIFEKIKE